MTTHHSRGRVDKTISLLTIGTILVLMCAERLAAHDAPASIRLARIESAVMAPDGNTLIVSLPSKGTLVYIDTTAGIQLKAVEVDFQPGALAVQGKYLFAATKGAPRVNVLDAATAKLIKTIKFPGAAVKELACHPKKGLLYATNLKHEVYAINAGTGAARRTTAKGQLIVVDPVDGKYVYTGIQKPIRDVLVIEEGPNKSVRISLAAANYYAAMLKYKAADMKLRLVAANDNAATNGRRMAISGDGKRIAMAGGGGYRVKGNPRANYSIAVFDTNTLKEISGQVTTGAYPNGIAFHPHLKLGAAYRSGFKELTVFRDKSYVSKAKFKVSHDSVNAGGILLFGGRGTNVVYVSTAPSPFAKESVVEIFSLPLSDADRGILQKAHAAPKQ